MTSREHGRPKPLLWHAKNYINFSEAILLLLDWVAEENYIEFLEEKAFEIAKTSARLMML